MEREVLTSNPLISYLSNINDENRSGVWGKGRKAAENLPEYEPDTKTIKHMHRSQYGTVWGEGGT